MAITKMQEKAINSDGHNVLVSASAGSGKTFVMIERVKKLILEKHVDVNKILCVTFTVLAAKEMKQKLSKAITEIIPLAEEEDRKNLERQLELLPTASISTIHAFCKNLLSEFFYVVGLDPAFSILDDKNTKLLVNRAIDRLFDDLYEEKSEDIALLLPYFFKGRKDKALKEKIISIYNAFISEADPEAILKKGEIYYTKEGIMNLTEEFLNNCRFEAKKLEAQALEVLKEVEGYEKLQQREELLIDLIKQINNCKSFKDLCAFLNSVPPLSKPVLGVKLKEDEDAVKAHAMVSLIQSRFKKILKNISDASVDDLNEEIIRAGKVLPVYKALSNVVIKFMKYYAEEKKSENAVDYSDLEHFTLQLLKNEEVKNEIACRYSYIFTDEYQDTSGVQEAILTSIARDNMFMVGDLKQSIYDFRGCNPDIFAEKFKKYGENNGGEAISLDKNFRSTKAVLESVNRLFSAVMTEECGRVDYKKMPMEVGAEYPDDEGETVISTTEKSKFENQLPDGVYSVVKHLKKLKQGNFFAEGMLVCELIENLVGKKEYYDIKNKQFKTVDYSDIVILLRDSNKDADLFTEQLARAGIPFSAPSKDSIANYAEVAFAVDLLRLIDCYNQDVALASVLKSKVVGLSDADLLKIRKFTPEKTTTFALAVRNYAKQNEDELAQKLNDFEKYFEEIRILAEFTPCGELLAKIISEKGIDLQLLASPMGEVKLSRLNKFIDAAQNSKQTVGEFMNGLDGLLEKLTLSFSTDNAVKVMSIHGSKGLEFPIVILARTTKRFNEQSINGDFIADRYYGVSINYRDTEAMKLKKTFFNTYLHYYKQKRMREEEMRLLYVAMTRAKNSLYITGEYDQKEGEEILPPFHASDVYDANCYFKMFAQNDCEYRSESQLGKSFKESEVRQVLITDSDQYMTDRIAENLSFEYPHRKRAMLAVKRSVTKAAHFEEEDGNLEKCPLFDEEKIEREELTGEGKIISSSSADVGNAYHRMLELCDFSLDPESAFNSAIDSPFMEEEYKALIKKEKAIEILSMPIFKSLPRFELYKEQPFTALMPASMVEKEYDGEEEVLVQGVIDLLAIKDGDAVIIDYKHSAIFSKEKLIKRYQKQLELYKFAVEKVLKKRVIKTYLINVNTCKLIEV